MDHMNVGLKYGFDGQDHYFSCMGIMGSSVKTYSLIWYYLSVSFIYYVLKTGFCSATFYCFFLVYFLAYFLGAFLISFFVSFFGWLFVISAISEFVGFSFGTVLT